VLDGYPVFQIIDSEKVGFFYFFRKGVKTMAKSIYLDKIHHLEQDIYVFLKEIFSFLSMCLGPILQGLCFIMAGFGGLIIMGWLMFLLLLPVLFLIAIVWSLVGF